MDKPEIKRAYYLANREKLLREQKERDSLRRDEILERKKLRYIEHRTKRLADSKKRRCKNQEIAKAYVAEYKRNNPCPCGEIDIRCLTFHHISEKKYAISKMCVKGSYPLDTIKAEIAKCEILCFNCHAKLHHGDNWLSRRI